MQQVPKLDYAASGVARGSGTYSAIASLCIGLLVSVNAVWAVSMMLTLDPRGETDAWVIIGLVLLVGAVAAAIGLGCALHGRMVKASPSSVRKAGVILNTLYLVAYAVLIGVVASRG